MASLDLKETRSQLKELVDRNRSETLVFPNEMEQMGQFAVFSIFEDYQYQRDLNEKQKISQRIILPLPGNLQTGYNVDYAQEEMGILGQAAAQSAGDLDFSVEGVTKFLAGTKDKVVNQDALKGFGLQAAETQAAPLISALLGSALGGTAAAGALGAIAAGAQQVATGALAGKGITRNPHMAVLFKGIGFRTHSFNYKLIANNQKESDTIRNIIYLFKRAQAPEYRAENHIFAYPNQFHIGFNKDKYLFKLNQSVLTSFSVNYHGEGGPFYHTVGDEEAPVSVTIDMSFTETRIVTKKEIDKDGA